MRDISEDAISSMKDIVDLAEIDQMIYLPVLLLYRNIEDPFDIFLSIETITTKID